MEPKKYILTEPQLRELLHGYIKNGYLEADGVDNWEGYGQGWDEYIAKDLKISEDEVREKDISISDVVETSLKNYQEA